MLESNLDSPSSFRHKIGKLGLEILFRSFWILWLGGLTLYISIVVPVATEVIGAQTQGEITAKVTVYINAFGSLAFVLLLIRSLVYKNKAGIFSAIGLMCLQGLLYGLHQELHWRLSQDTPRWWSSFDFYTVHRVYLWSTTAQWLIALGVVLQESIQSYAWRDDPRRMRV